MSRFESGWIKLYRSAVGGDIGRNGVQLAVFVTLLCWANRFEGDVLWRGERRVLSPGMVVIGIRELAAQLGFSKDSVARALRSLTKRGTIHVESSTRGTLITICNWAKYQKVEDTTATPERHDRDASETPNRHEPDLIGEEKKKKRCVDPADATLLFNFYSEQVRNKSIQAIRDRKSMMHCHLLVKQHGLEKAKQMIQTFVNDPDPFVADKAYAIGLLVSQQQKYSARANSTRCGRVLSAEEVDRIQAEFNGEATGG